MSNISVTQGSTSAYIRNDNHSKIMASLITELNSRLNSEIRAQTEYIASNVVNMVESKLHANDEMYGTQGPGAVCTDNITTAGNIPASSTIYNQAPQDVRITDAQEHSQSAGPSGKKRIKRHTTARDTFLSTQSVPAVTTDHVHFHPSTSAAAMTSHPAPSGGLGYHNDGKQHVFRNQQQPVPGRS